MTAAAYSLAAIDGIEQRAQIDTETFKGLLPINGGGAIALLSFLAAVLNKPNPQPDFARAVLWGVLLMMLGLVLAILHNHLRRRCSLIHEHHQYKPPAGKLFGIELRSPTVCFLSWGCMWLSLIAFFGAGLTVAIAGLRSF